jgi:hypothetical protein
MKTAQYIRQEKAIHASDADGIRERWLWGLRLLNDPERMSSTKSLKHGVMDELITAADAAGVKLTAAEIRARLQCARAYKTEAQISRSTEDFEQWSALVQANFPPYEIPPGEPPADYRTDEQKKKAANLLRLDTFGEQGTLFPLDDFVPAEATLKDLQLYTEQMEELTARFARRDRKRRTYFERLAAAAHGDLSMTWQEAHDRLGEGPIESEPPS